jgi:hypothetical protein
LAGQKSDKLILDIRNANLGMEKFSQPEPWILGTPKFVKETLERDCCKRARTARHLQEDITCGKIHEKIEYFLHLPTNAIYR